MSLGVMPDFAAAAFDDDECSMSSAAVSANNNKNSSPPSATHSKTQSIPQQASPQFASLDEEVTAAKRRFESSVKEHQLVVTEIQKAQPVGQHCVSPTTLAGSGKKNFSSFDSSEQQQLLQRLTQKAQDKEKEMNAALEHLRRVMVKAQEVAQKEIDAADRRLEALVK